MPNQFAALACDAANLMIAALQKAGVDDRSKVKDALVSLQGFQGATGSISYANSHDPEKERVRITIKNGEWVLYQDWWLRAFIFPLYQPFINPLLQVLQTS